MYQRFILNVLSCWNSRADTRIIGLDGRATIVTIELREDGAG